MPDVGDDPDYLAPGISSIPNIDPPADRVHAREVLFCQRLAYDRDSRRAGGVTSRKGSPGHHVDSQRAEIVWTHLIIVGAGNLGRVRILLALDNESLDVTKAAAERQRADRGCRLDARQRLNVLDKLAEERRLLLGLFILGRRKRDQHCQNSAGVESRVDLSEPVEAAKEQTGANHQRDCECDLGEPQESAKRPAPAAAEWHNALGKMPSSGTR